MESFATARLCNDKRFSRYTWAAGQYPRWDEEFIFHNVSSSFEGVLKLELCDADRKGRVCNTVGHVCISLADLMQMRRFTGDLKLVNGMMQETTPIDFGLRGNRGKLLSSRDQGILSVDIKVTGDYKDGEKELLEALQIMGFDTSYGKLKQAGFSSIFDLYPVCIQNLSEAFTAVFALFFMNCFCKNHSCLEHAEHRLP